MIEADVDDFRRRILQLGRPANDADEQEMQFLVEQLIDQVTRNTSELISKQPKKLGNPAVVGLAGFGITTLLLQLHNLGCMKSGPVFWSGLIYGGLAQFLAGILEFITGNNFGLSAFTTYGAFWIALVATNVANDYSRYEAKDPEIAVFLAVFALYTIIMFVASMRHNAATALTFASLALGLVLLSLYHFFPTETWLKVVGPCVLIISALSALYLMSHLIFLESFQFDLLPVGPPLHKWLSSKPSPSSSYSRDQALYPYSKAAVKFDDHRVTTIQ